MAGKELLAQGDRRRKAILKYLRSYAKKNGMAPTIQEIADAVSLVSPNATRNHLRRLEEDGYITTRPRIARAIILVDPAPDGWTASGKVVKVSVTPTKVSKARLSSEKVNAA